MTVDADSKVATTFVIGGKANLPAVPVNILNSVSPGGELLHSLPALPESDNSSSHAASVSLPGRFFTIGGSAGHDNVLQSDSTESTQPVSVPPTMKLPPLKDLRGPHGPQEIREYEGRR